MYVEDFWGHRLLPCMFQTSILNAEPTVVEWFILSPATCTMFWNDHSVCMCVCVHAHVEGPSGHTLTGFRGFQCTTIRANWRWSSFRKVHLLRKPFGNCFVWQGSQNTFLMCCNPFFFFFFPFYLIFHAGMEEEKVLLWINKDCLQLLHGFAFLRFCVGSQELQSTIKPAPRINDFFTVSWWRGHTEFPRLWYQCLWVVWNSLGLGLPSGRA